MTAPEQGSDAVLELRDVPERHEVRSEELVHRGWVWNLKSETAAYGDGEITREFIDHTGAVSVVALDEQDRVLLIRQYRHPVGFRQWELPAGLLDDPHESPLVAAQRELAEEADYAAEEWSLLLDFWTTPGGCNESIRIFLARGLTPTGRIFERVHEEADIETAWVPLDEAVAAILRGDLHNPAMLQGVFAANEARRRGWETLRPADAPWPTKSAGPSVLPRALADGNRA